MKLIRYSTFLFFSLLLGCSSANDELVSVSFPLYKQCDKTLQKVDSWLRENRTNDAYEFQLIKNKYDVSPNYGDIPYGHGTMQLRGKMELLNSTPKEYLELQLSSMFADCMPNNSAFVGGNEIASEITEKFGSGPVTGYTDAGKFWVLYNDGTYQYEE